MVVMDIGVRLGLDLVGVRELRQNLSVYLDRVKRGETLVVTEHHQRVALLTPIETSGSIVERLVNEGRATPARRTVGDLPPARRVRLGTPMPQHLDASRDDIV